MMDLLEPAFFVLCCVFIIVGVLVELHCMFTEPPLYSEPDDYPERVKENYDAQVW